MISALPPFFFLTLIHSLLPYEPPNLKGLELIRNLPVVSRNIKEGSPLRDEMGVYWKNYPPYQLLKTKLGSNSGRPLPIKKILEKMSEGRKFHSQGDLPRAISRFDLLLRTQLPQALEGLIHYHRGLSLKEIGLPYPALKAFSQAHFLGSLDILLLSQFQMAQINLIEFEEADFFSSLGFLVNHVDEVHMNQLKGLLIEGNRAFGPENFIPLISKLLYHLSKTGLSLESAGGILDYFFDYHKENPEKLFPIFSSIEKLFGPKAIPLKYENSFIQSTLSHFFNQGVRTLERGEPQKALEHFLKITDLQPRSPFHEKTLFYLGYLYYFHLGNIQKGKWYLMQLNNPISMGRIPQAALYLALIHQEAGEGEKGFKLLKSTLPNLSRFPTQLQYLFHFSLVNSALITGQVKFAQKYFNSLLKDSEFKKSYYFALCQKSLGLPIRKN